MKFPQSHTSSYYASSINRPTNFPTLTGHQSADVCVIGAGFTGISTALHLAERGYSVHVVDANKVGWGASGRNGGQMIGGISGEAAMARVHGKDVEALFGELRWAGHDIIRQRVKQYGIECDLKPGYLDVAIKPRHLRDIEADFERLQKSNFPYETRILSRDETCDAIGTDAYIGSLLNMGNGHLHPLNLCIGEAHAAASLGVSIFENSPVVRIDDAKQPVVVTETGDVTADAVVLAGNAYHNISKKIRGLVFPVHSYIIATEPLTAEQVASVNPHDLAVCDPNFVLEYFRLSADKRLLFGGRINYFGDNADHITHKLRRKMIRVYPQLAKTRIDFAWGGRIGVPINRVPQMGRLADNVFYSQGYSGHGVNVTHLAGQILADAVAGTMERFDLFSHVRSPVLPAAYALRKPLTSLGILYFKLKDRL